MNIEEFLQTLTSIDDHITALNTLKFLMEQNLLKDLPHTIEVITDDIKYHADVLLGEMERYFDND